MDRKRWNLWSPGKKGNLIYLLFSRRLHDNPSKIYQFAFLSVYAWIFLSVLRHFRERVRAEQFWILVIIKQIHPSTQLDFSFKKGWQGENSSHPKLLITWNFDINYVRIIIIIQVLSSKIEACMLIFVSVAISAQGKQAGHQVTWIWGIFLELSLNMNFCVSLPHSSRILFCTLKFESCQTLLVCNLILLYLRENLTQLRNRAYRKKMFSDGTLFMVQGVRPSLGVILCEQVAHTLQISMQKLIAIV